jgi:hypothetical protein
MRPFLLSSILEGKRALPPASISERIILVPGVLTMCGTASTCRQYLSAAASWMNPLTPQPKRLGSSKDWSLICLHLPAMNYTRASRIAGLKVAKLISDRRLEINGRFGLHPESVYPLAYTSGTKTLLRRKTRELPVSASSKHVSRLIRMSNRGTCWILRTRAHLMEGSFIDHKGLNTKRLSLWSGFYNRPMSPTARAEATLGHGGDPPPILESHPPPQSRWGRFFMEIAISQKRAA